MAIHVGELRRVQQAKSTRETKRVNSFVQWIKYPKFHAHVVATPIRINDLFPGVTYFIINSANTFTGPPTLMGMGLSPLHWTPRECKVIAFRQSFPSDIPTSIIFGLLFVPFLLLITRKLQWYQKELIYAFQLHKAIKVELRQVFIIFDI